MTDVLYAALPLDRAHDLRRDEQAQESLRNSPDKLVVPFWRELSLIAGAAALPEQARQALFLDRSTAGAATALMAHGVMAAEALGLAREVVFLGKTAEGAPVFAADLSDMAGEGDGSGPNLGLGGAWLALRTVGGLLPPGDAALLGYARAMLVWHRRSRFCGACGAPTESREGGHLRQCLDAACNTQNYPRTDPAVIMRVTDGDSILLHRQRSWPAGQWSVLAGFVEPGETLEEAVAREVREETGVLVEDVRYAGSQPWPFPSSVMLAYTARAVGGVLAPDPHELEDARWFSRTDIRTHFDERHRGKGTGLFLPTRGSIAHRLITDWLAET